MTLTQLPAPTNQRTTEHIFVSYSSKDRPFVSQLVKELHQEYPVWIDNVSTDYEGLRGGEKWQQALANALNRAVVVVLAVTPDALTSEWVRAEIHRTRDQETPLIPFIIRKLDDISSQIAQQIGLNELHFIDATIPRYEDALHRLLNDLQHYFRPIKVYESILVATGETRKNAILELMAMANGDEHSFPLLGKLLVSEDTDITWATLMVMKNQKFGVPLPASFYAILNKLRFHPEIDIADWAKAVIEINVEAT